MSDFSSVVSVGGLLPADLLGAVAAGSADLEGTAPESYGLVPGERLNDQITRSWNRLTTLWGIFGDHLDGLSESEATATTLTRERWLRPLFDELGFAGLNQARATEIDGKEYAISHQWDRSVAVHLLGARVAIDRRSPGVPGAARSSPHGLVQEYLNRSDEHLWALVSNGLTLRVLRDNASLTRQAYLEFDLQAIFEGELYSDFALLWLVCHRTRFEGDPPEKCLLEQWAQHAASAGTRALDRLRDGVEEAIETLGKGFLAHRSNGDLRRALTDGSLSTVEFQRQLLRTVYRLLFLLVAEARDLLLDPSADEMTRLRYREHYSLGRLVRLAGVRRGSSHDDLWTGLQLVVDALWTDGQPALGIAPLGSFLWSPESVDALHGLRLDNAHLLEAIRRLTWFRDGESKVDRLVDYRNQGAEELGSIYESLLELHAEVDVNAPSFSLRSAAGNERKTTGSYYTPSSLINELLDSALDPVLDEAAKKAEPERAILDLSVLDPACGSGHFLIAAANRMALRLASVRAGGIEPAPDEARTAMRDVVGRCIHGIDVNPMAVELCKVGLWLEAMEPGKPLSFLDHRIVHGDGLLGATPRLLADGVPDGAFQQLEGDDKKTVAELKKRNKAERKGQGTLGLFNESISDIARPIADGFDAIDAVPDDTADQISRKAALLVELSNSPDAVKARLAADAWCAAFVAPKAPGEPPVTTSTVRQIMEDPALVPADTLDRIRNLSDEYRFVHPHLAFPDVISVPDDIDGAENDRTGWSGGFSIVLGNPPWKRVKLQEKEFFAGRDDEIAGAPNAAARKRLIAALEHENPGLFADFKLALRQADGVSNFLRRSGRFPLCGRGDVNTYTVFAESMRAAVGPAGRAGVIVPSGIATDDTTKYFFQDIVEHRDLVSLFDFENRKAIFDGVHRSYKFCLLTLSGSGVPIDEAEFVFFALDTADLNDTERRFTLTPEDFALLNPNTRTCPIFRTRRDAEITKGIYRRVPVLIEEGPPEKNPWGVKFSRMFDMSNDSNLFRTREELEGDGWTLQGNIFTKDEDRYLPLYEGKMVHHFDHRWATYEGMEAREVTLEEKMDPAFVAQPRYWVPAEQVQKEVKGQGPGLFGWRKTARNTDARTLITSPLPVVGVGDKYQLFFDIDVTDGLILTVVLNSFTADWTTRQKHGGTDLSYFTIRQIAIWHDWPVADHLREFLGYDVSNAATELVGTSWDVAAGLKLDGCYRWNAERRLALRAELDGALMHLYGIEYENVEHMMESFPIIKRHDVDAHSDYRTKKTILDVYERMRDASAAGVRYQTLLDPAPADPSLRHDPDTRPDWTDLYLPLEGGD